MSYTKKQKLLPKHHQLNKYIWDLGKFHYLIISTHEYIQKQCKITDSGRM